MIGDMLFLVFGSQPILSLAETAAVLGSDLDYSRATNEILLLEKPEKMTLEQLQDRLAGIIKIGQVVGETMGVNEPELADLIAAFIPTGGTGKVNFGMSVYNGGNPRLLENLKRRLQTIGLEVKRRLKNAGVSSRYVSSRAQALSSVIVVENHLLDSGGEFVLIAAPNGILVGQTQTVQGYKEWSKRDFGRPARDARSGMLPPKLARIMINLSGTDPEKTTLLDPFCGSGTIPMEAALMGYQQVIGSDISPKAVRDTEENLRHVLAKASTLPRIFLSAAEDLSKHILHPVDTVITETFLGPPGAGRQSATDLFKTVEQLKTLYTRSFSAIAKILKPHSQIVAAFPAYLREKEIIYVMDKEIVQKAGLIVLDPLPSSAPSAFHQLTPSGGLFYRRKDQRVAREILLMKKV
ncbi:MAG: methlyase protein [Candidatus Uhrbacteria bacterium GW2011_GWA2_53_10]|uniref:Methlyase protein n=1 Tax=Candidatus Uhrbacteria bacterium GW2011_GWA2_53_10 TaxID=1618980 RepID=A0A0G1ZWQ7_9BACT|nr:MAG: methlyase protein [Candidatus Uhrbacteria bacterium GW2011_GWA2_53_10]